MPGQEVRSLREQGGFWNHFAASQIDCYSGYQGLGIANLVTFGYVEQFQTIP